MGILFLRTFIVAHTVLAVIIRFDFGVTGFLQGITQMELALAAFCESVGEAGAAEVILMIATNGPAQKHQSYAVPPVLLLVF
uniref:Oxidoreductase n=1 Tax=Ascaris lumbricoides TaxID=6252 RepID=A0A0M3HYV3_ASCLU